MGYKSQSVQFCESDDYPLYLYPQAVEEIQRRTVTTL